MDYFRLIATYLKNHQPSVRVSSQWFKLAFTIYGIYLEAFHHCRVC